MTGPGPPTKLASLLPSQCPSCGSTTTQRTLEEAKSNPNSVLSTRVPDRLTKCRARLDLFDPMFRYQAPTCADCVIVRLGMKINITVSPHGRMVRG